MGAIVWVYSADWRLHGVDADTGAVVFGGGPVALTAIVGIETPIVAKGRIFLATNNQVYALAPN